MVLQSASLQDLGGERQHKRSKLRNDQVWKLTWRITWRSPVSWKGKLELRAGSLRESSGLTRSQRFAQLSRLTSAFQVEDQWSWTTRSTTRRIWRIHHCTQILNYKIFYKECGIYLGRLALVSQLSWTDIKHIVSYGSDPVEVCGHVLQYEIESGPRKYSVLFRTGKGEYRLLVNIAYGVWTPVWKRNGEGGFALILYCKLDLKDSPLHGDCQLILMTKGSQKS